MSGYVLCSRRLVTLPVQMSWRINGLRSWFLDVLTWSDWTRDNDDDAELTRDCVCPWSDSATRTSSSDGCFPSDVTVNAWPFGAPNFTWSETKKNNLQIAYSKIDYILIVGTRIILPMFLIYFSRPNFLDVGKLNISRNFAVARECSPKELSPVGVLEPQRNEGLFLPFQT